MQAVWVETRSDSSQSSACQCLQLVFPSVLVINFGMNWSVYLPTPVAKINPQKHFIQQYLTVLLSS